MFMCKRIFLLILKSPNFKDVNLDLINKVILYDIITSIIPNFIYIVLVCITTYKYICFTCYKIIVLVKYDNILYILTYI